MIKTLNNIFKQDKEKFVVPKGVQDCIPLTAIYDDGIFRVGKDKYSKSFKFTDINYAVASREDKEAMFLEYSELLNSLDSGATTKLTINNRRLNRLDFEKTILIPETGDELDEYREEYNKMLLDKATGANSTVQDKYVTISINKKNVDDARTYFARVGADLISHFSRLGSKCVELETDERLRIIHDFFRVGEETSYHFDIKETRKKGHDFKDYICPDSLEFESDYFKIGNRYGRVIFLREYASYIKDSMVAELTDMNRNLMMSIDIVPVPTDEAVREAENRLLGVETNITNWQRKQNMNNNFSATVPYDMEQQKKEMKEFLDDLTTRDQRMMFAVLTMVHTADTKEQLDNDTEALLTTARKHLCQFAVLKFQQMDGLNTVMPYGTRKIDTFRTLTTESLAVFIPFRVQDIYHENGIYYGQNVISKNMIIADRKQLLNGNSFILGVSGGGKSFAAKGEIENIILSSDADVIIIDPEREYSHLVNALGGEIINISATSNNHINAMDIIKGKKPRHKKIKYLNQFELHKLLSDLNLSQEINWDWFILLVAKTGMRFSEALAITPKDFDFSKQSLSINKTWDYKGGGGFMPTKNQSSVRKIQIDWQLIIQFSTLVKDLPEDEPIFVSEKVYNSTVNDILTRHCKKADIPVISVHGLRHTHASLLLFAGVSIASVAQRLGHSSMTTTQKTYLHIIQELENKDVDLVMRSLSSLN